MPAGPAPTTRAVVLDGKDIVEREMTGSRREPECFTYAKLAMVLVQNPRLSHQTESEKFKGERRTLTLMICR
jgi:hypothetical protein